MTAGEMPEIEMNVSDDTLDLGEIDLTPVLLRRLTWDIMPCSEVAGLLTALGLTHGTDEGMAMDHRDSHHRMAQVYPLENYFQRFSEILGVITATALTKKAGVDLGEGSVKFAEQNQEVILHSARAIVAQLIEAGVLTYGIPLHFVTMGEDTGE